MSIKIGNFLKYLAMITFGIGFVAFLIWGIVYANETDGMSMLSALIGIVVLLIPSGCMYGLGEIIDKLCKIEKNTRQQ